MRAQGGIVTPHRIPTHCTPTALVLLIISCDAPPDSFDRAPTNRSTHTATGVPGCVPVPDGVIGWWPGDGSARDISQGRDGVLVGGVTFAPAPDVAGAATLAGKVDQAFAFNGSDAYIDLSDPASARGLSAFTLSTWVNVSAPPAGTQYIYAELGPVGTGARVQFYLQGGTGKLVLDVKPYDDAYPGHDRASITSREVVTPGQWVHVAGTWETANGAIGISVFVNGSQTSTSVPAAIGAPISDTPPGAGVNYIGGSRDGLGGTLVLGGTFRGGIDELQLVDRALQPLELEAITAAGAAGACKPAI
jgi:hypothetical protein